MSESSLKNIVILIIDDNKDSLEPNVKLLQQNGYTVYGALLDEDDNWYSEKGEKINYFNSLVRLSNIIFLDHYLNSNIDGEILYKRLKKQGLLHNKRVIGVSNHPDKQVNYLREFYSGMLSEWRHTEPPQTTPL